MKYKERFTILFQTAGDTYIGVVHTFQAPSICYFSVFIKGQEVLLFVDDEQDQWVEHNAGSTPLAKQIGGLIDKHYHPDHFLFDPTTDSDQSLSFQ